jgi:hypothetical protein
MMPFSFTRSATKKIYEIHDVKILHIFAGLLFCVFLIGCAHTNKVAGIDSVSMGAFKSGGVTYYPAHPGTTNYGTVDFTTNPPPAGVRPSIIVVSSHAHWGVKLVDGNGVVSTNTATK